MKAEVVHRKLNFKRKSGTSRGILTQKDSWFLTLVNEEGHKGIGECSVIKALSPDCRKNIPLQIVSLTNRINNGEQVKLNDPIFEEMPAMQFCYETALKDLNNGGVRELYKTDFLTGKGIPINGLVWMGCKDYMLEQIKDKIKSGYNCIKIKIASIDFGEECSLLKYIRKEFTKEDIEIRVDANGGFAKETALEKLKTLSNYGLHSIEQPISPAQWQEMALLCAQSPLPIALDEELIDISIKETKSQLLDTISPPYIILKPSLLGGFESSEEWIALAEQKGIAWWATSALEANIGLNAIAQWTAHLNTTKHQGLGTGQLFTNNINSPLYIDKGFLYSGENNWGEI